MKNSHIEWTDHTFNPWEGCTKVSPGCAHCYAEARNQRFAAGANWGPGAPRRRTSEANWKQPLRWDDEASSDNHAALQSGALDLIRRPRVFCASLADWLDHEVPIEWLADLLDLIRRTPNLDWLLLTKRPENWRERLQRCVPYFAEDYMAPYSPEEIRYRWLMNWLEGHPPANVWIGATVEDQQRADERIPALLQIPARVRFLSCEPLLEMVVLKPLRYPVKDKGLADGIDWVICGGESGRGARPIDPDWARSLRDQCRGAGIPFFFKQWGEWLPGELVPGGTFYRRCDNGQVYATSGNPERQNFGTDPDQNSGHLITMRVGKLRAGRLLDGKEHNEFPASALSALKTSP